MSVKDILVHLDGSELDAQRCAVAFNMAKRFEARLTGLFARIDGHTLSTAAQRESDILSELRRTCEQNYATLCAANGITSRFWHAAYGAPNHVISETASCARFFDLVVLGQRDPAAPVPADFIEQVIQQSGRPCVIAPPMPAFPMIGTNVVVAWNGTREGTRAIHDAMPFIKSAERVEVISVHKPGVVRTGAHPPANISDHLAAHNVTVLRENLVSDEGDVMDLILSRASDLGANLLVMGGESGSHFPFIDQSSTRRILQQMNIPIFISR